MEREFMTRFTFKNKSCSCMIEHVVDDNTGKLIDRFVLKPIPESNIPMAYHYGYGLKSTIKEEKTKNNILGEFLGIQSNDFNAYKSFFENYGFLFKLKDEEIFRLCMEDIEYLKNNLLAFVYLLNNQFDENNKEKINYDELLKGFLYLLFKKPKTIKINDECLFSVERNYLANIINESIYQNEDKYNVKSEKIKGQIIEFFEIDDELSENKKYKINCEEYNEIRSSNQTQWCKNLFRVFKNKHNLVSNNDWHIVVDFLIHFITEVSIFNENDVNIDISFDECVYDSIKNTPHISNGLIKSSKVLLKYEFENSLSDIHPIFNVDDMMPDWGLQSLYSSLYFSLFYINNKNYGLRKCANSKCNEFFQVSKSNSTKKYCSWSCGNNENQRRYQSKNQKK